MIGREIPITFLESPDIVFSLVPDQDWYLKVDQISPTLMGKHVQTQLICMTRLCTMHAGFLAKNSMLFKESQIFS